MTFSVAIEFHGGRCSLVLDDHALTPVTEPYVFTDLVVAVADLAEGRRSVSVRWSGSAFLDMSLDHIGHVGIAVHGCVDESPRRGDPEFATRVPFGDAIMTFAKALWRTRVRYADDFGFIEEWGWLVPKHHLDAIMTRAGLLGFHPPSQPERELGPAGAACLGQRSGKVFLHRAK
ncbi:hypothetical protein NLX83_32145 [Allokutzneria sp. A3M-2-11 16]|uniref:hypothetical protein n=1 Tax=Allokutzneria sp. A3M-2-11 16 TaxID=2962043 RepID=UPI0020B83D22|nr:hypothetical protein [Allokutzneria sp. A3M-2-11 16]MCP3803930.1 hypothetical protein [Allokutzneria sp. A3M-2-11 16]